VSKIIFILTKHHEGVALFKGDLFRQSFSFYDSDSFYYTEYYPIVLHISINK